MSDTQLQNALEIALWDVPAEVFGRIKATVDGEANIAVSEWISFSDDGTYCGCLLFDGFGQAMGQDELYVACEQIRDEDEGDKEAASILSGFYGVTIPADVNGWAMSLVQAYDQWAQQEYDEDEESYQADDGTLSDFGRAELRVIFAAEQRRRERVPS